jgi:hypothetical protein
MLQSATNIDLWDADTDRGGGFHGRAIPRPAMALACFASLGAPRASAGEVSDRSTAPLDATAEARKIAFDRIGHGEKDRPPQWPIWEPRGRKAIFKSPPLAGLSPSNKDVFVARLKRRLAGETEKRQSSPLFAAADATRYGCGGFGGP